MPKSPSESIRPKTNLTPPLKWAGGKRWLAPLLTPDVSQYKSWVTPFSGGLGLTLSFQPPTAVINDINSHLINFYSQIAAHGLAIPPDLCVLDEAVYYARRQEFNQLIQVDPNTPRCAALFYYLNKTGFNGLCRFNQKGLFNVPFGKYKQVNYRSDFKDYQDLFRHWQFLCHDFEQVQVESDAFVYLDPPYDGGFTAYSRQTFTWDDQQRLASWAAKLTNPLVVSNKATDRILALYKDLGFVLYTTYGPRHINNTGDRKPVQEMIATKNLQRLSPNQAIDPVE